MPDPGWARQVGRWLFPGICSLCMEAGGESDPCEDCRLALGAVLLGPACPRCAEPLTARAPSGGNPAGTPPSPEAALAFPPVCSACTAKPPPFDRVRAPWRFASPLSGLIHRMKYHRDLAAAASLGRLLARELRAQPELELPQAVIGMPLSTRRIVQRGFNHAGELAAIIRRELTLPRPTGIRVGRKHTPPQAKAGSAEERQTNVAGAFKVLRWPPGIREVAIVDDVLTTGATASAAATALKAVGVERIEIWCCARTTLC